MSAAVIAFGAVSGLGRGEAAASAGEVGERARVAITPDDELAAAKLARPFCARADVDASNEDRATAVLRAAWSDLEAALEREQPGWRQRRVGLALATSSGGMRGAERVFRALHEGRAIDADTARRATYFAPMVDVVGERRFEPSTLVLTACSASTIAIGLGLGWLERGACDLVIAGGFDAVSVFVASGFEALRATTARLPSRPFGAERDGMALGEGAALLALVRAADVGSARAFGFVQGFGASGDAVHVTAPDRTGAGLARAARGALAATDPGEVGLVSAHGTATPFNDAAEWKAIRATLGDEAAARVVVHPFKAQIGHTLGAAGALESLAALDAMRRGVLPAAVVPPARDPETPARLLERAEQGSPELALKLSAAFGGANAALALRRTDPGHRPRGDRAVYLSPPAHVAAVPALAELALATGVAAERLARADELVHLAMAALARLPGPLRGAGIVVGHAYATVDVNDRYFRRVLERGDAKAAEPRRFPYTSPNAVAGECSLAFELTGPNVAVGSGLHGGVEALVVAADLVRSGVADRVVAVAVDAPRATARAIASAAGWPVPRDGAVAVLVSSAPLPGSRRIARTESASSGAPAALARAPGHEALVPLAGGASTVGCASPWGAYAWVECEPAGPS